MEEDKGAAHRHFQNRQAASNKGREVRGTNPLFRCSMQLPDALSINKAVHSAVIWQASPAATNVRTIIVCGQELLPRRIVEYQDNVDVGAEAALASFDAVLSVICTSPRHHSQSLVTSLLVPLTTISVLLAVSLLHMPPLLVITTPRLV